MTYRDAARKLKALGCVEIPRRGSGSHRKWQNPATNRTTVLPDWGSKDLKPGTLRAAVRQLGLNWDDFDTA
ncbi:MAG TPA: type II toxin-antitoxin system HicA family toxin [Gemmata sp.]